jgi:hypothetical protein
VSASQYWAQFRASAFGIFEQKKLGGANTFGQHTGIMVLISSIPVEFEPFQSIVISKCVCLGAQSRANAYVVSEHILQRAGNRIWFSSMGCRKSSKEKSL